MHSADPADLSPLSFGAGLALGLMLIIGLPRAAPPATPAVVPGAPGTAGFALRDQRDGLDGFDAVPPHRPAGVSAHR